MAPLPAARIPPQPAQPPMMRPSLAVRRGLARIAFALVLAFVLYEAFAPHPAVTTTFHQEDKLFHALAFMALAVTMRLAFPQGAWWAEVGWALGIGIGIELVQSLEPTRVASGWDVAADAVGIGIGWLVLRAPVLRHWNAP